jgi:hypothetical protein
VAIAPVREKWPIGEGEAVGRTDGLVEDNVGAGVAVATAVGVSVAMGVGLTVGAPDGDGDQEAVVTGDELAVDAEQAPTASTSRAQVKPRPTRLGVGWRHDFARGREKVDSRPIRRVPSMWHPSC